MKTGRVEKNRRGMEEDTWKKVPVGEKHLRLIIDHLSNEASSRGLSSKSLCAAMFPTVENPPCVVADVRCFFLDGKCRRREVLFRFNDTLSHTSVATYALCLYLSSLCSSSRISVSIPFRSPLPTTVWINRERNFWRTRWRANNERLIKLAKNYFCLKIKTFY